jgi:hypothetical protein
MLEEQHYLDKKRINNMSGPFNCDVSPRSLLPEPSAHLLETQARRCPYKFLLHYLLRPRDWEMVADGGGLQGVQCQDQDCVRRFYWFTACSLENDYILSNNGKYVHK